MNDRGWHLIHGPLAPCPACGSVTEACAECVAMVDRLAARLACELGRPGELFEGHFPDGGNIAPIAG